MHGDEAVSEWVARWTHLVKPGGTVLDVACGKGRHSLHFLRQKCHVARIDIAQSAIDFIVNQLSDEEQRRSEAIVADIENGPWPVQGRTFDAVVVTNYLWRPLMPAICASVAAGGVLIYETFARGNESVGKPSRPDFLLRPGELLEVCHRVGLRVIAYEDGFRDGPARFVQRVVAVRPRADTSDEPAAASMPDRYAL
jgi:SAM-dependent methyltransferase